MTTTITEKIQAISAANEKKQVFDAEVKRQMPADIVEELNDVTDQIESAIIKACQGNLGMALSIVANMAVRLELAFTIELLKKG